MSSEAYKAEHRVGRTWWGVRVPTIDGKWQWFDYPYEADAKIVADACNLAHAAALAARSKQ